MATVCAGTLALMDAGVRLKKPVSGIAMGLIRTRKLRNMLFFPISLVMKIIWVIWTLK